MAIGAITQVTQEGYALGLASFKRQGQVYLMWSTTFSSGRTIWWKPHNSPDFSEVKGQLTAPFLNIAAIEDPVDDLIIVAYDDAVTEIGTTDTNLYVALFNPITGALVLGPTRLGRGMKPSLLYRNGLEGEIVELVYASRKSGSVYVRESLDGGHSWSGERPILNNYVKQSADLVAVPYDDEHLSIVQLGYDARGLVGLGAYTRTRPLVSILKHPTLADRYYVTEPSSRGARLSDNLRGGLDGTALYHLSGDRLGTNDGNGSVMLLDTSGLNPVVDIGTVTVTDIGDVFGGAEAVDISVGPTHYYVAGYSDSTPNLGSLFISALGGSPTSVFLSGLAAVRAVAVSNGTLFVATLEGSQPMLRVYQENALTPTLITSHKMPARVNRLLAQMTSPTEGLVFVSMMDRLNIYKVSGLSQPIRLVESILILSRGSFFQVMKSSNGNLVAAMGYGGVGVFNAEGGPISSAMLAGVSAPYWQQGKAYVAGDLVTPTPSHVYSPQRKYFRCLSSTGISGYSEPPWCPLSYGNVSDSAVVWQEAGSIDAVVTGVALDETRKRIYAVGVVGGPTGVTGRVFSINARGLI